MKTTGLVYGFSPTGNFDKRLLVACALRARPNATQQEVQNFIARVQRGTLAVGDCFGWPSDMFPSESDENSITQ